MCELVHPTLFRAMLVAVATLTMNSALDSRRVWAAAIELTEAQLDGTGDHSFR